MDQVTNLIFKTKVFCLKKDLVEFLEEKIKNLTKSIQNLLDIQLINTVRNKEIIG
jgi:hypothetical protein